MMGDPVQIDWDLLRRVCNLPGASPEIHMRRDEIAAIVAFVDTVRRFSAEMPAGIIPCLDAISGPSPSPAVALMEKYAAMPWPPDWVDDEEDDGLDEHQWG